MDRLSKFEKLPPDVRRLIWASTAERDWPKITLVSSFFAQDVKLWCWPFVGFLSFTLPQKKIILHDIAQKTDIHICDLVWRRRRKSGGKLIEGPRKTYNTRKECSNGFLSALQYITRSLPNFNNIHSLQISCYQADHATCMDELVELLFMFYRAERSTCMEELVGVLFQIPSIRWLYVDSPLQELGEWIVSPALQDLETLFSSLLPFWPEPASYPKLHRMVITSSPSSSDCPPSLRSLRAHHTAIQTIGYIPQITRLSLKEWTEEKLTVRLLLDKLEPAVAACSDQTRSLTVCFRTFLKDVSGQDILQHFSSWASRKGRLLSLRSLERDGTLYFRLRLAPRNDSVLELEAKIRLTGLPLNVWQIMRYMLLFWILPALYLFPAFEPADPRM